MVLKDAPFGLIPKELPVFEGGPTRLVFHDDFIVGGMLVRSVRGRRNFVFSIDVGGMLVRSVRERRNSFLTVANRRT